MALIKEMSPSNRRHFLRTAGTASAFAALGLAAPKQLFAATPKTSTPTSPDTPAEIFTAALVAEDLAITFYYNALIGEVIQDPNLAGPGGTATKVSSTGSVSNVYYLRAALHEENIHADLFRSLLGITGAPYNDPYLKFYMPTGPFGYLSAFIPMLSALENAFIAAYLAAIQEFSLLAAAGTQTIGGTSYTPADFTYYAAVAASILGVESEHRALGRAISPNILPANQLNYEQQNGIFTVYNGTTSAVAALTPFLAPGDGLQEYGFPTCWANSGYVSTACEGTIPTQFFT
jgi:hypothetical protein